MVIYPVVQAKFDYDKHVGVTAHEEVNCVINPSRMERLGEGPEDISSSQLNTVGRFHASDQRTSLDVGTFMLWIIQSNQ